MSTPKKGEILYYVQSDQWGLSWMGIAYQVTTPTEEEGTYKYEATMVATAVSGSEKKVRSMLKAKLKKKGIIKA